jgi:cell division protein FtsA
MAKPSIVTAIDIGTSTIKGVQVREAKRGEEAELVAAVKVSSDGIRKGVVDNIQKVAEKIAVTLEELRRINPQPIQGVFANIGGGHLFVVHSKGEIAVSRADREISQSDVERVLQVAQTFSLPPNREILEAWPRTYIVDQEEGIREPIGMKGMRLGVEILALCGFSPYVKNTEDAIVDAGVQVFDIIPSPIAAARAVLTQKQKELGCALVDIGARTTDLAVFEDGELVHVAVFPVGSANITDDIAVGLQIPAEDAEQLKLRFGLLESSAVKASLPKRKKKRKRGRAFARKETLSQEDSSSIPISFSKRELGKIVRARVCDIFDAIAKELKNTPSGGRLPGGVVLCGGGAQLSHILEFAKQELRVPCSIGVTKGIAGIERDPSFAVACGLALEALASGKETTFLKGSKGSIATRIKEWFELFIP